MGEELPRPPLGFNIAPADLNTATASTFEGHIGLEFVETTADRVCAKVTVGPSMRHATGAVRCGLYCSIVDTVASWGGLLSLGGIGHVFSVNNNTDFLRNVADTTLMAEGLPVIRNPSQQLWRVVITDVDRRECAVGHVRLQNVFN